jgi:hypothetical protein
MAERSLNTLYIISTITSAMARQPAALIHTLLSGDLIYDVVLGISSLGPVVVYLDR